MTRLGIRRSARNDTPFVSAPFRRRPSPVVRPPSPVPGSRQSPIAYLPPIATLAPTSTIRPGALKPNAG